jgi:hypothetical protein
MTSYHYNIAIISIASIGFVLQLFPMLLHDRSVKWCKRVTNYGWSAILIAILMLIAGILNLNASEQEKQDNRVSDSLNTTRYELKIDSLRQSLDSSNNVINDIDSLIKEVYGITMQREGNSITFIANNNLHANLPPEPLTLLITIGENGANLNADGKILSHPYLMKPINEISADNQSYLIGSVFNQDVNKGTITALNGYGWFKGQKIILKR